MKTQEIIKIKPKQTRTKMTEEELARYMDEVKKSSHTFKSKKDYNRQKYKKGVN